MKKLLLFILLFPCKFIFAQDTIYRVNHEKIVATVQEVDPDVVKYKRYGSTDGPLYIVKIAQIQKIVYADGHVDTFNGMSDYPSPKGNWLVGLNSFDLMFGLASINAEYYFPKHGIAIRAPFSVGINTLQGKKDITNNNFYDNIDVYYYSKYKTYTAGLGLIIYPGHLSHTVNYFVGFSLEAGLLKRTENWYPSTMQEVNFNWYGTGVINGVQIKLSDRLNIGLDGILGVTVVNNSIYNGTDYQPMARMDISLQFRIGNYPNPKL